MLQEFQNVTCFWGYPIYKTFTGMQAHISSTFSKFELDVAHTSALKLLEIYIFTLV